MKFLLVTPVTRNALDNGGASITITGAQSIGYVQIDDVNLQATATFAAIEDVGPIALTARPLKTITVAFAANTTMAQLQLSFKAALSAAFSNVALQ